MIDKTLLPQVSIRKVYVNQDNVVINGFMTAEAPASGGSPFWMDEKYFSQYIDIYFIIDHFGVGMGYNLAEPEHRVANYSRATSTDFEDWDFFIKYRYDHKIISLTDITLAEADIVVSDSEIMSNNPDDSGGMLRDIAFSIEIPLSNNRLFAGRVVNDISLCAFTHLNFNGMVEDFNLSTNEQSYLDLMKIGGNFVEETILTVGQDSSGNSVYRVPETITTLVFKDENGNDVPYHGLAHYHGPDNEGPDGYIGWMEGPLLPMHPNARRLREVEIPYTKVVANFLLDDTLFVSGYDGSEDRIAFDYESTVEKPDPGFVYDPNYIRQKALENFYKTDRRGPDQRNQPIIYNADHWLDKNDSNQIESSLTFTVDFKELIKTRSRYPLFYDRYGQWFDFNEQELQKRSKVKSFRITRYRLSNSARSNNDVCTADYNRYSNEDIEETVFFASQPDDEDSRFIFPGNLGASYWPENEPDVRRRNTIVREGPDAAGDGELDSWYQRTYKLVDKKMNMFNFGKYAYNIYMHIDDAVKVEFIKVVENFRESVQGTLLEFISLATTSRREYDDGTAFNESELVPPGQLKYVEGYDFDQRKYTEHFKLLSQASYDQDLREIVDTFVNLQGLIGTFQAPGSSIEEEITTAEALKVSLKKGLIPAGLQGESGDLDAALRFSEYCNNLILIFDEIFKKDSIFESTVQSQTNNTVLGQKSSSDKTLKIIDYNARIPGFNEALNAGDVFVEYDINNLNTLAGQIAAAPTMFSYLQDEESTAPILDVSAWQSSSRAAADALEAGLEVIMRTPPEQTESLVRDLDVRTSYPYVPGQPALGYYPYPENSSNAADVNLNTGDFSSTDIATPLGSNGGKAINAATGQFSQTKQNTKIETNRQKNNLNTYRNKTIAALGVRLAHAQNKKSKGTSTDLIKSKSKKLLVREGKSSKASYIPATEAAIRAIAAVSDDVYLKVDDHVGKEEGSYKVSSPPVRMPASGALDMIKTSSPEPDPPTQQSRRSSTQSMPNSPAPILPNTGGSY